MSSPLHFGLGSPSLSSVDFSMVDQSFDLGLMGEHDYLKQDMECITGSDSELSSPNSPLYQENNIFSNINTTPSTTTTLPTQSFINTNNNVINNHLSNNIINNINNNHNNYNHNNINEIIHNNNNQNQNQLEELDKKPLSDANGNLWAQLMPMLAAAAAAATGGNASAAANAARQFLKAKRSQTLKNKMNIEPPTLPISIPAPPLPPPIIPTNTTTATAPIMIPPTLPIINPIAPLVAPAIITPMLSSKCIEQQWSSSSSINDHSSGEESMDGNDIDNEEGRPPVDVKRKRLARKAELARMSRKRKKTRMGDLEAEVERLQKEIATLKKQMASDAAANAAAATAAAGNNGSNSMEEDDVKKVYDTIGAVIEAHSKADPSNEEHSKQLLSAMDQFVHTHTRSVQQGAHHLSSLRPHLSPILPLHFLHWLMSQQDRFYDDPSSLWSSLFLHELQLSGQQMKDLAALRTTVKKQGKLLTDIEKGFRKLNIALKKQLTQRVENLEKVRSILSTNQLAKFLAWVTQYGPLCLKVHQNEASLQPANVQNVVANNNNASMTATASTSASGL